MKVLITGGAGFIGSHLVKLFDKRLDKFSTVTIADDFSGGNKDNIPLGVHYYEIDCRDKNKVDEMFKDNGGFDLVYCLAANAAEGKSHFSPIDITTRNYNSFLNVLVAGINHGMKKMVITSSVAVYGSAKPPFSEDTKPEPEDLYGLSKLNMEKTLDIMSKVYDFKWASARAHNVYGPSQSMKDPYRNVVTIWMNKILKGEPYTIYGDGSMKRCYTYVEDLVEGLYNLKDHEGIFNLGADEAYSLKDLSNAIQNVSGGITPPQYLPARVQEVETAVLLHDKAKKELNYQTRVSLIDGIQNTWEWAKSKGYQELNYTDFEIDSPKIPANWRR